MTYVDGCVAAIPTANKEAYRELAKKMGKILTEDYGALSYVENWGEDVPDGEVTSFKKAVQCKDDETVIFSWVIWPSKEVRNQAMEKMQTDARVRMEDMPFDGKRLIYGGFDSFIEM